MNQAGESVARVWGPGRTRRLRSFWAFPAALVVALAAAAATSPPERVPSSVFGTWCGEGTLLGRAALFELAIEPLDDGDRFSLRFRNAFAGDGTSGPSTVLQAAALYWPSDEGVWEGRWIDSRALTLNLEGEATPGGFSVAWSGAESGRTVYTRIDEGLVVVDSVFAESGPRAFGEARYRAGTVPCWEG